MRVAVNSITMKKILVSIQTILFALSLILVGGVSADSKCKGLSESQCNGDGDCTWVSGYEQKDGDKVSAYCRAKPGKGDSKDKKKKDKADDAAVTDKDDKKENGDKEDKAEKKEKKKSKKKKDKDEEKVSDKKDDKKDEPKKKKKKKKKGSKDEE